MSDKWTECTHRIREWSDKHYRYTEPGSAERRLFITDVFRFIQELDDAGMLPTPEEIEEGANREMAEYLRRVIGCTALDERQQRRIEAIHVLDIATQTRLTVPEIESYVLRTMAIPEQRLEAICWEMAKTVNVIPDPEEFLMRAGIGRGRVQ